MDGKTHLSAWLQSGRNYQQGLDLARAHGIGGAELRLLESGNNAFTQGKLRQALQRVLDQLASEPAAPASTPAPVATAPSPQGTPPAAEVATSPQGATPAAPEPPELVQLRTERLRTFKEAQHHFGQMRAAAPGPGRKAHAKAVKRLWRENARLWAAEEYYQQFGFLPPAAPVATLDLCDPAAVLRKRNTLRTYISGRRGTPEKQAAWSAELLELNLVLEHGQPV